MADANEPRDLGPDETIPWMEIPLHDTLRGLDVPPFRMWFTRVKSSSSDSELLIHDPLTAMLGGTMLGRVEGVTPESKIRTLVVNHEKTLYYTQLRTIAVVGPDGDVTLVQVKQAG
jgi:hypothetical protein